MAGKLERSPVGYCTKKFMTKINGHMIMMLFTLAVGNDQNIK